MPVPVVLGWTGGAEGALLWDALTRTGEYEVVALLTTLTQGDERVSTHGVRRDLLQAQSTALRVPLEEVFIAPRSGNDLYEAAVGSRLEAYKRQGVNTIAFGDLLLTNQRDYRESFLRQSGFNVLFPLWNQSTSELARNFLDQGWRAVVSSCDGRVLDADQVGKWYDRSFLSALPNGVTPCGELGEFHTFLFDGPAFSAPIIFRRGTVTQSGPFWYCDLSLVSPTSLCA